MLALDRSTGVWEDRHFGDFPHLLRAGDVLILNDSRVIPARLFARRRGDPQRDASARQTPQGRIEVLLTEQQSPSEWRALVRPGKKVAVGERLFFSAPDDTAAPSLSAQVIARGEFGERTLRFDPTEDFFDLLDRLGHMPLPPYIHRSDEQEDRERYQTVFARTRGSVAAPTAGLHFTPEMLRQIEQADVEICYVTLHVGLGTFQPVRVERLDQIHLHTERYTLPQETAIAINAARLAGRRVVAAGTTTVRVLEHCATLSAGGTLAPHSGNTQIFLAPGHHFSLGGRPAHQFPLAPIHLAHAGLRLRWPGTHARRLSPRGRSAVPILLLRRLHVHLISRRVVQMPASTKSDKNAKPAIFLLDAMSFIFRAYHAMQRQRPMSTRTGVPTAATYVFVNMINKLRRDFAPEYFAAIFDTSAPVFRDERAKDFTAVRKFNIKTQQFEQVEYGGYKANRTEMPRRPGAADSLYPPLA